MSTPPRHTHDCEECLFLGPIGEEDLWFHDREDDESGTLIFRSSSEPSEYSSYSIGFASLLVDHDPKFGWALARAEEATSH